MAQPIEVPQTVPNAPQFQLPTDLVNGYLNRQQNAQQYMGKSAIDLGETYRSLQQQKIQNQMAALGAISQLYAAGGPRAVTQYAAPINQATGIQIVPQSPSQGQPPIPPVGTSQNATVPTVQDQTPSPYIQASLAQGHPDVAGVGSFHAPQPSPSDIQDMESGGTYGRNKAQSFKDLGDLSLQPITAAQKQLDMQKTQNDISMFPTDKAIKEQTLKNSQAQIPMEVNRGIASEVSKQGQDSQQIGDLQVLAQNMQKSLGSDLGTLGNVKGDIYQMSGGRHGSAPAAEMQNSTIPLATGLNTVLSRRFNAGEVQALGHSLIPQPKDTPQYQQQKLANLNSLLKVMASGNEKNVKDVASAIMTGAIPKVGITQANPTQSNIPTISDDSAFKALPSGATFKDPSGQVHRKK